MKLTIAQINSCVENITLNFDKISQCLEAIEPGPDHLIVFPELSLCGYPPTDRVARNDFLSRAETALTKLVDRFPHHSFVLGSIYSNKNHLYNAAFVVTAGCIQHIYTKQLLPEYDIFYEERFFSQRTDFLQFEFSGKKIGLIICEDMWKSVEDKLGTRYAQDPILAHLKLPPDILINISASPYQHGKLQSREKLAQYVCQTLSAPLVFANSVGNADEILFDGSSFFMNQYGAIEKQFPSFEEHVESYTFEAIVPPLKRSKTEDSRDNADPLQINAALTFQALSFGIRDFFSKCGQSRAVIGLSGGIDSAVVAVLTVEALGAENVYLHFLPSPFSSELSKNDALKLAQNLNCEIHVTPIEAAMQSLNAPLKTLFPGKKPDHTEENIQSRIRGTILMAVSNAQAAMVINTGNKSELAMGYCTLYGDLIGSISPLGDLYKQQVYQLAHYINQKQEVIPTTTLTRPPTAELRENQADTDTLPPYELLDLILYYHIEHQWDLNAFSSDNRFSIPMVKSTLQSVKNAEFKRKQAPPILRVSEKAFGVGRRFNIACGPYED